MNTSLTFVPRYTENDGHPHLRSLRNDAVQAELCHLHDHLISGKPIPLVKITTMKKVIMLTLFLFLIAPVFAQEGEVFATKEGAINGYDPVAYFKQEKAVKGKKELTFQWKGASWYFSSEENLEAFKSDPEKFSPQYGGYCAYGTAEGHKATTQPDAWTVVSDKLYLNYNKNVKSLWMKDQKALIEKADKNWPAVKTTKLE
jgi:YHS domain-containing protein